MVRKIEVQKQKKKMCLWLVPFSKFKSNIQREEGSKRQRKETRPRQREMKQGNFKIR